MNMFSTSADGTCIECAHETCFQSSCKSYIYAVCGFMSLSVCEWPG